MDNLAWILIISVLIAWFLRDCSVTVKNTKPVKIEPIRVYNAKPVRLHGNKPSRGARRT